MMRSVLGKADFRPTGLDEGRPKTLFKYRILCNRFLAPYNGCLNRCGVEWDGVRNCCTAEIVLLKDRTLGQGSGQGDRSILELFPSHARSHLYPFAI